MQIDLTQLAPVQKQAWLQHAIAPRPIAFASTIDKAGNVNLSPFSFFNLFSSNPPVVIFSPVRRVRDNTTKHTLQNIEEVAEVVINICDYDIIQQVSLASCEYAKGTDEFIKAGFTKQVATIVKPPMVAEAKIKLECKVIEIKSLGSEGGAGQLVIAEVLVMHVDESILNEDKTMIAQEKLNLVARLGGDWYCKISPENLFKVEKPNIKLGIGIDALPDNIKYSKTFTGNDLGKLANISEQPVIDVNYTDDVMKNIVQYYSLNPADMEEQLHIHAKNLLDDNKVAEAWQVLLA